LSNSYGNPLGNPFIVSLRQDQHVFVSHANQDHAWAGAACAALEQQGLRCWIAPRDMRAGVDWPAQIIEAISHAALMVLILSEHANRSSQVLREVDRAVNHNVNVLALRIGDFALSKNLEYFISMCHWLDARPDAMAAGLDDLCVHARVIVGMPAGRPVAKAFTPEPVLAAGPPRVEPVPAHLHDPALLRNLESELAAHLGPIARHLVRKAALTSVSDEQLIAALAAELASDAERRVFLQRCRNRS